MSDRLGLDLLAKAKLPGSPGEEKLTKGRELSPVVTELLKAEGSKPKGRLSQAAVDALLALNENDGGTQAAKDYIKRLKSEAPALLWRVDQPTGVTTIRPGHASLPIFINRDGWAVPSATIDGKPREAKTILEGVYALEEAIRRQLRISRFSLDQVLPMNTELKAKMIEKLISTADMARDVSGGAVQGLTAAQTMEMRSSAFTCLLTLAVSLDPSTQRRLIDRVFTQALDMAKKEPDRWLGDHMVRMLNYDPFLAKQTGEQKELSKEAWEGRHRQKFEVKNITDAEGFVRWDHVCGEGEGFFESFKTTMQQPAINGAKFKVVPGSERWNSCDLIMEFNPPRTVDGQTLKGIKMHIRGFDNDMFDAVGKNIGTAARPVYQGFSYGGHSEIGENQERSLATAIARGQKATTPQIAVIDLCAGLDNLDADMKALGDIDLMTTHDSSYFSKGEVRNSAGTVIVKDGVPSSEGQDILIQTLSSLTNGENYTKMHERFTSVIDSWQHMESPNTHTPIFPNYEKVLNFHLDADGDGVMDARDIHFHCQLTSVKPDLAHEFQLKPLADGLRSDLVKGTSALNAVLDLNVATHYQGSIHNNDEITHKFVADGFFDGEGQKDMVRFSFEEVGQYPRILVQYNSQLAHTTREALEALTMYQSMMMLADRGDDRSKEPAVRGVGEVDRKLMALAFAVFRLNYDGKGSADDARIWKQLLEAARLPADLPLGALESLIDAEHNDYSGNLEIVHQYKAQLPASVVSQLEKKDVGRPVADVR